MYSVIRVIEAADGPHSLHQNVAYQVESNTCNTCLKLYNEKVKAVTNWPHYTLVICRALFFPRNLIRPPKVFGRYTLQVQVIPSVLTLHLQTYALEQDNFSTTKIARKEYTSAQVLLPMRALRSHKSGSYANEIVDRGSMVGGEGVEITK